METNCAIHWIEIYPVDSAIRRLNNRGQLKTNAGPTLTTVATMPSAIIPKVPLTVVANQGIAGMATTVQVGACEVLSNIIYLGSPILVESPLQPTLNYWGS